MTYSEIYESYAKFCKMVGTVPMDFEEWMQKRDAPPPSKFAKTKEFLEHARV